MRYEFPSIKTFPAKTLKMETIKIKDNERFVGIVYNSKKGKPGMVFDVAFKIVDLY